MNYLYGSLMVIIGLFLFICALLKTDFIIYRLFHARSKILWGEKGAHIFLAIVGVILMGLSSLFFFGIWG